jgi:hypothetical protein
MVGALCHFFYKLQLMETFGIASIIPVTVLLGKMTRHAATLECKYPDIPS